jgi:hypothetical protein
VTITGIADRHTTDPATAAPLYAELWRHYTDTLPAYLQGYSIPIVSADREADLQRPEYKAFKTACLALRSYYADLGDDVAQAFEDLCHADRVVAIVPRPRNWEQRCAAREKLDKLTTSLLLRRVHAAANLVAQYDRKLQSVRRAQDAAAADEPTTDELRELRLAAIRHYAAALAESCAVVTDAAQDYTRLALLSDVWPIGA